MLAEVESGDREDGEGGEREDAAGVHLPGAAGGEDRNDAAEAHHEEPQGERGPWLAADGRRHVQEARRPAETVAGADDGRRAAVPPPGQRRAQHRVDHDRGQEPERGEGEGLERRRGEFAPEAVEAERGVTTWPTP